MPDPRQSAVGLTNPWAPGPWIQFDALLDRITGQYDHQNRSIPIFNELLVARLCQQGLMSGILLSIDGFVERPELLDRSVSDVFVACTVDHWYTDAFLDSWAKVRKRYACKVLITLEPIFTPLSMHFSEESNARERHERFLRAFDPDIILYNSSVDCEAYRRLGLGRAIPLSFIQADPMELACAPLSWDQKHPAILFAGQPSAWEEAKPEYQGWSRAHQVSVVAQQAPLPLYAIHEQFTHRACYDLANLFRFQLCPRSGYAFHPPRVIQSALVGSIPVILLNRDLEEQLHLECPLLREDHNCLVGYDGEYEELFRKLKDEDLCRSIASHLPELLGMGTFEDSMRAAAAAIRGVLEASGALERPAERPSLGMPPPGFWEKLLWAVWPGYGKRRRRERRRLATGRVGWPEYDGAIAWGHREDRPIVFAPPPHGSDPLLLRKALLEGEGEGLPLLAPYQP